MKCWNFMVTFAVLLPAVGFAELGLFSAAAVEMPKAAWTHAAGGTPDCNNSEYADPKCETHPDAEPGSCSGDYRVAYTLTGNLLDVHAGELVWRCTSNNCKNVEVPAVTTLCNHQDPPGPGT